MTAKIYEIKSGREIKGPSLKKLREDSAKVPTATGMNRQAEGKQIQKGDAERLMAALERRMARST